MSSEFSFHVNTNLLDLEKSIQFPQRAHIAQGVVGHSCQLQMWSSLHFTSPNLSERAQDRLCECQQVTRVLRLPHSHWTKEVPWCRNPDQGVAWGMGLKLHCPGDQCRLLLGVTTLSLLTPYIKQMPLNKCKRTQTTQHAVKVPVS